MRVGEPILRGVDQGTGVAQRELKHVVVREHVRQLIQGAEPGTPAPSERELVAQFNVARMTVRQALDALVAEGLLERMPGRGTFVARPRRQVDGISSFTEDMRRRGRLAESQTLLARVEQAGPGVARALEVKPGDPVVHWRRLRRAQGTLMCLQDAYLSEALLPDLLDRSLPTSLYEELAARGLRPTWAEDAIQADQPSPEERSLLELTPGGTVLRLSRRAVARDKVVEVSRSVFRSDRFTMFVQLGDLS